MARWSSSDDDDDDDDGDNGGKSRLESKSNSGSRCEPGRTTSPSLLGTLTLLGERLTIGVSIGVSSEPDEARWLEELEELILNRTEPKLNTRLTQ